VGVTSEKGGVKPRACFGWQSRNKPVFFMVLEPFCHSGPDFRRDKLQPESSPALSGIKEEFDIYTITALLVISVIRYV